MISKFKATGCLDDIPRSGRPITSGNASRTVQQELEIIAGSFVYGEISARKVARHTGIPYTTVWIAVSPMLFVQNSASSRTIAWQFCEEESICGVGA